MTIEKGFTCNCLNNFTGSNCEISITTTTTSTTNLTSSTVLFFNIYK
jgi:hypothetical protein